MSISTKEGSVLVIAHDHDLRVELRKILEENYGLTVFSTADPVEGLSLLLKIKTPRLVLLSKTLPMITYKEFLTIKSRSEEAAAVPVILITLTPLQVLPAGAHSWIYFPIRPHELTEAIAKLGVRPK